MVVDKVPNIGTFSWNVPGNFIPGQYILTSSSGPNGVRDPSLVSIVVGTTPVVACEGLRISSSSSLSSTSSETSNQVSTISSTSAQSQTPTQAILGSSIRFEQILHQTGCQSPLIPIFTSTTISSSTTSFLTIGCPIPTPNSVATPSCYSEYTTYTLNPTSVFCCPSNWRTVRKKNPFKSQPLFFV